MSKNKKHIKPKRVSAFVCVILCAGIAIGTLGALSAIGYLSSATAAIANFFGLSKTYTITYDANGGVNAPGAQLKYDGVSVALSVEEPSRENATFLGWAEIPNEEASWAPGDSFNLDSDITLYAKWQLKVAVTADDLTITYGDLIPNYSYSFDAGNVLGIEGAPEISCSYKAGDSAGDYPIEISAGTLSCTDCEFSFVAGTLHVLPYDLADASVTLDVEEHKWEGEYAVPSPTVTAHLEAGDTLVGSNDYSYSYTLDEPSTVAADDYSATQTVLVSALANSTNYVNSNTATWIEKRASYRISYNTNTSVYNGASKTAPGDDIKYYDVDYIIPTQQVSSSAGATLCGWNETATATTVISRLTENKDTNLYAVWNVAQVFRCSTSSSASSRYLYFTYTKEYAFEAGESYTNDAGSSMYIKAKYTCPLSCSSSSNVPWLDSATTEDVYYFSFQKSFRSFRPKSCAYWFYNCTSLKTTGGDASGAPSMTHLNLNDCTSLRAMFYGCSSLETIPYLNKMGRSSTYTSTVGSTGVSNIKSFRAMFYGCKSFDMVRPTFSGSYESTSIDSDNGLKEDSSCQVGNWDTSSATTFESMFRGCTSLYYPLIAGWTTTNVTTMTSMFRGCSTLVGLGFVANGTEYGFLSKTASQSCTDLSYMFYNCSNVPTFFLRNWDVNQVVDFNHMFAGCTRAKYCTIAGWVTSAAQDMSYMWSGCTSLETIYATTGYTSSKYFCFHDYSGNTYLGNLLTDGSSSADGTGYYHMFYNCTSLSGSTSTSYPKVAGTAYSSSYTGYSRAHVDMSKGSSDGDSSSERGPGYFTRWSASSSYSK